MSKLLDVSGTGEDRRKEMTPKVFISLRMNAWAYGEESYDCHREMGRYLELMNEYQWTLGADILSASSL